jgi:hypothetical protein
VARILTCVSVRCRELENSARSAMLRYCFSLNFFSKLRSCCVVNGVRGLRFGLCLRKFTFSLGGSPLLESESRGEERISISFKKSCFGLRKRKQKSLEKASQKELM